ncbi:hypothetical protein D7D25_03625 [Proteiniphilum sp. X52]|nr:hypothetical protein D7D25_03625 [Proteiniphilum sp. X52]
MKLTHILFIAILILLTACYPQKEEINLILKLEQFRKDDCENLCHKLKISIFNPTENNFLLPALYIRTNLFVVDNEGREYIYSL